MFVTAGLGGMSGAQAKAAVICGCVGVIAEVSLEALQKRWANSFNPLPDGPLASPLTDGPRSDWT